MTEAPGFWRRLRRALLWMATGVVAASVVSVAVMRWAAPLSSAFIVSSYLEAWRDRDFRYRADYRWTPYAQISRHAKLAVIASEDQKFAFHPGFDFEAID